MYLWFYHINVLTQGCAVNHRTSEHSAVAHPTPNCSGFGTWHSNYWAVFLVLTACNISILNMNLAIWNRNPKTFFKLPNRSSELSVVGEITAHPCMNLLYLWASSLHPLFPVKKCIIFRSPVSLRLGAHRELLLFLQWYYLSVVFYLILLSICTFDHKILL